MRRREKDRVGDLLASLAGGLAGALIGGYLVRLGVRPCAAAAGVTVAGGLAALAGRGRVRSVGCGAAAMGVSQLALAWMQRERELEIEVVRQPAEQEALKPTVDIDEAFEQAREQVAMARDDAEADDELEDGYRRETPSVEPELFDKACAAIWEGLGRAEKRETTGAVP